MSVAGAWHSLGYAHHNLGNHPQALPCYENALRDFRHLRDRSLEATVLESLGDTYLAMRNPEAARTYWQQAVDIYDDLHHSGADPIRDKIANL